MTMRDTRKTINPQAYTRTREFNNGTFLVTQGPYSTNKQAKVRTPEGKLRTTKRLGEADTFFSIPASVTVHGKTVSGYVSINTDTNTLEFHPYKYCKNGNIFDSKENQ